MSSTVRKLNCFDRHYEEAMEMIQKLSGFFCNTGITDQHMLVAHYSFPDKQRRLDALRWAIENEASPAEMVAWDRLQHGEDVYA